MHDLSDVIRLVSLARKKAFNSFYLLSRSLEFLIFSQWVSSIPTANAAYPRRLCLFLLGPAPCFVWFLVCFLTKRKSGWGICGSSWLVLVWCCFCLVFMWIAATYMATVLCTQSFLDTHFSF